MFKKHACYLSICLLVAPLVATADALPVEPLPVTTPAPVDLARLVAAAQQLPVLIGHDIPSQIAKAGPRLALHSVPADFDAIRERALSR